MTDVAVEANFVEKYVKPYMKAIMAFVLPFAGNLVAAMQENSHSGTVITGHEWLEAGLLAIITAGAVWGVTNTTVQQSLAKRREAIEAEYEPQHAEENPS